MEIIILDSGVNQEHPRLLNKEIQGYGLTYSEKLKKCIKTSDIEDRIGHGTAVYDIIRQDVLNATIKVIKIFNDSVELSEDEFFSCLLYVYHNETPDIINLSLGLTYCEDISRLYNLCRAFKKRGTIILSAFDNEGAASYPASFDCVYGVMGTPQISNKNEIAFVNDSYVNILAKGTINKLAWKHPEYVYMASNSFSCAIATAGICNLLLHKKITPDSIPSISEALMDDRKPSFTIKKAAIFPFNKEMHALIRFSQLLNFEIVAAYDHRLSGKVGSSTCKILNLKSKLDLEIKNIDNIDWNEFDTIILGHLNELSNLVKDDSLKRRIIESAYQKKKNIYSFDSCEKTGNIFFPQVKSEYIPKNHFGKLFKISKPVVGIFGTSSKQGKFSLQLTLREYFCSQGYHVGQLGTEPTAYLFGMDEMFPYGYNSAVNLSEEEALIYINRQMHAIAQTKCEIILVGSQSATISYNLSNTSQFVPYQNIFLNATQPDAIILVISPQDTIDYIERTLKYIEGAIDTVVIAICLFPNKLVKNFELDFSGRSVLLSGKELDSHKTFIEKSINRKVYILGIQDDMNELADEVISFFST